MVLIITSKPSCCTVLLLVIFMNMYSILHAFVIPVIDCWVVLLLLLSLYCIDLFSCKAASVFAINLLTYLLTNLGNVAQTRLIRRLTNQFMITLTADLICG